MRLISIIVVTHTAISSSNHNQEPKSCWGKLFTQV